MQFKLRLIPAAAAAVLLAACGGGGGTDSSPTGTPTSGKAVDGYLSLSKVVCDSNDNGVADTGEPVTYTDLKGNFVFATGCAHGVLASGGTNADTGLAFVGQLRAPAGAAMVTPLTTLVASGMTQAEVITALNLPTGTNLLTTDPAATNSSGELVNASLMKKTLAVQQMLQKTTELFTGMGAVAGSAATTAVYTEVAAAFATQLKTGDALFDNSDAVSSTKVNTLVSAAVTRTGSASTVSADIKTALTAAGGATAIATVVNSALTSQAQEIMSATSAADLTAKTLDRQSNTSITDTVKVAVASGAMSESTATDTAALADLAGRVNAVAEKPTEKTTVASLPVYFDESVLPVILGFNGAEGSSIKAGPTGGGGKSLNVLRTGGDPWAGVKMTTSAIPFAANHKTISARVYSPKAGIAIKIKAETASSAATAEAGATTTVVVGWQTLTWVLSDADLGLTYTSLVLLPDLGTVAPVSGDSYFFDNIQLVDNVVAPVSTPSLPVSFDDATVPVILGFNGAEGSTIKAGLSGGTGKALNVLRTGGDPWAGVKMTTSAIPFAAGHRTITARVYSPKAGVPIKIKAETAASVATAEAAATTTVVVGWQTLTWVLSDADLTKAYTSLVLLPDLGTVSPTSGDSYFFDDITLTDDAAATPSNYVYLDNNSIGFSANGTTASAVSYSMANFQSSTGGINIKWPMANAAALKLNLKVNGNFSFDSSQTLSAAVRIQETGTGSGEIRAYTDKVAVSRSGDNITLSVPNLPQALIYGVSGNGQTKAVIDFASKVRGITNTLSTASGAVSTVMFGEVVNFGITGLSNQFTSMSSMRGKYKVTIVVNELPLRKADGTQLDTLSIDVPTTVSGGVAGSPIAVTGYGLVGYINLTD